MTMSKDRVKFFLNEHTLFGGRGFGRHYSSASADRRCAAMALVLKRAFRMSESEVHNAFKEAKKDGKGGLTIVCRPSQFARFIIYWLDSSPLQHLVKSLKPELYADKCPFQKLVDWASDEAYLGKSDTERVLLFLKKHDMIDMEHLCTGTIDVSKRVHDDRVYVDENNE